MRNDVLPLSLLFFSVETLSHFNLFVILCYHKTCFIHQLTSLLDELMNSDSLDKKNLIRIEMLLI